MKKPRFFTRFADALVGDYPEPPEPDPDHQVFIQTISFHCRRCNQPHRFPLNQVHIGGAHLDLWHPCPTLGAGSVIPLEDRNRSWMIETCGVRLDANCPDSPESLM